MMIFCSSTPCTVLAARRCLYAASQLSGSAFTFFCRAYSAFCLENIFLSVGLPFECPLLSRNSHTRLPLTVCSSNLCAVSGDQVVRRDCAERHCAGCCRQVTQGGKVAADVPFAVSFTDCLASLMVEIMCFLCVSHTRTYLPTQVGTLAVDHLGSQRCAFNPAAHGWRNTMCALPAQAAQPL